MNRRDFIQALSFLTASQISFSGNLLEDNLYDIPSFGKIRILHTSDTHAQLRPVYFREPSVNIGLGDSSGKPPHLVGDALLEYYRISKGSRLAYALTHIGMDELANRYGRMGGFSHLMSLMKKLRGDYKNENVLYLDSGDMLQGSATALYTLGEDMVRAANLLGLDAMVGHWEFTYPEKVIRHNIEQLSGEFLSQNIRVKEEALFDGAISYNEDSGHAFKPYTIKELNGYRVAIIGQSFPYTPISNPIRFIENWSFGIRSEDLQSLIDHVKSVEKPHVVILLSHNGTDLDQAIAQRLNGIDIILGGHTHDALYQPIIVNGVIVANAGCAGKFLGCLDIDINASGVFDYRWHLLPIFSRLLPVDSDMEAHIQKVRAPHEVFLSQPLAIAEDLLYRRGNFNGTMDQLILDSLRSYYDTDIAFSPGFRWGNSVPARHSVTMEDIMNVTAITYPETYSRMMRGHEIQNILESVADNLYHPDPFYRQGGDMIRVGGMSYTLDPTAKLNHRVSNMRLDDGTLIEADQLYSISGWATVSQSNGPPIWNVLADYLRQQKNIKIAKHNLPILKNVRNNQGISNYPRELIE